MRGDLATTTYKGTEGQVSWCGVKLADGDDFNAFMSEDVAARLHDSDGTAQFESHLRGLASTGFARESLEAVLATEIPEERDWAVGEALAETYLAQQHKITWPWNMERDKRTPMASLPGADLVGFEIHAEEVALVLGEVKTSTDPNTPPGVMKGRSGMTHQLDRLATHLSLVARLIKWLWFRCKGTENEASFDAAAARFFASGNKAIALFGVLVRDTHPNELDLKARGRLLASSLEHPTTCQLIAVHIPCSIADLPARVSGGPS